MRADPKISVASLSKPGFALFWKMKLNNEARQLNALMPPTLMDRHIGIHGFRSFGFVTGSGDKVYAVDTDLARIDWQKNFGGKTAGGCVGDLSRRNDHGRPRDALGAAFPRPAAGRTRRRGAPRAPRAPSASRDEGGITVQRLEARRGGRRGGRMPGRGGGSRALPAAADARSAIAVVVNSLSSDGMFHANYRIERRRAEPAIKFLPPNANAQGLIIVDNVAYVATVNGCGGVPNGMWALDIATKAVTSWKPRGSRRARKAPAFGPDGTLYVATTGGDLVSLEAKTLKVKDVYRAGQRIHFTPGDLPVQGEDDGRRHDQRRSHSLDRWWGDVRRRGQKRTVLSASDFIPGALATWQDASGTRWILAPTAGRCRPTPVFRRSNGAVTNGAVVAWKVVEQNGGLALEPGWVVARSGFAVDAPGD